MLPALPDTLTHYPSYCFKASPTYTTWAKLTAKDVYALTQPAEYEKSGTYFYLNHPIKYVQLVGIITAFESLESRLIFALDDSSGEIVNVVCACGLLPRPLHPDRSSDKEDAAHVPPAISGRVATTATGRTIDMAGLDIGDAVKVKGFITIFRNEKQISLERISRIPSTNEEVTAWQKMNHFRSNVLTKEWHLSTSQLTQLRAKANSTLGKKTAYPDVHYGKKTKGRKLMSSDLANARDNRHDHEKRIVTFDREHALSNRFNLSTSQNCKKRRLMSITNIEAQIDRAPEASAKKAWEEFETIVTRLSTSFR